METQTNVKLIQLQVWRRSLLHELVAPAALPQAFGVPLSLQPGLQYLLVCLL